MICRAPGCRKDALRVVFFVFLTTANFCGATTVAWSSSVSDVPVDCLVELDAIVAENSNNTQNTAALERKLEALAVPCEHLPQIAHNRGVLAARAGRWPEAIIHFENALAMDQRAAMTHRHLQQIFEHRAAIAYARALGNSEPVTEPTFTLQNSTLHNADARQAQLDKSAFHNITTVDYELFAWWQAHQMQLGITDFYVDDFPVAAIENTQRTYLDNTWQDLHREIAFTANDAVVVLSDTFKQRILLLLRLVGTRWKIYQETLL